MREEIRLALWTYVTNDATFATLLEVAEDQKSKKLYERRPPETRPWPLVSDWLALDNPVRGNHDRWLRGNQRTAKWNFTVWAQVIDGHAIDSMYERLVWLLNRAVEEGAFLNLTQSEVYYLEQEWGGETGYDQDWESDFREARFKMLWRNIPDNE